MNYTLDRTVTTRTDEDNWELYVESDSLDMVLHAAQLLEKLDYRVKIYDEFERVTYDSGRKTAAFYPSPFEEEWLKVMDGRMPSYPALEVDHD